jgi:hypothetical protein
MEINIKCPHCYSKKMCFETTVEDYSSFLCFRCGFMSDTRLVPESEFLEKHLENTPYLVESLSHYDINRKTYKWKACKYIETDKDNYSKELDVENGMEVNKFDFLKTLDFMEIIINKNFG